MQLSIPDYVCSLQVVILKTEVAFPALENTYTMNIYSIYIWIEHFSVVSAVR